MSPSQVSDRDVRHAHSRQENGGESKTAEESEECRWLHLSGAQRRRQDSTAVVS